MSSDYECASSSWINNSSNWNINIWRKKKMKIAFIGYGNMANALINGILASDKNIVV